MKEKYNVQLIGLVTADGILIAQFLRQVWKGSFAMFTAPHAESAVSARPVEYSNLSLWK